MRAGRARGARGYDAMTLALTAAISDYDHTRDLADGRVRPEGIELTCLCLPVEEIFYRFIH